MPSFALPTGAYVYRPLKKGQTGWDIYALQTALESAGQNVGPLDGIAGSQTDAAIRAYQTYHKLVVDGIAGVATQRHVALRVAGRAQSLYEIPAGAFKGQMEAESGYLLGNHTAQYSNGTYDIGVTQRNTAYASIEDAFNTPKSLKALGSALRQRHDEYKAYGKVTDEFRLWQLAQGSWNRPAWTQTLAKGGTLATWQSDWIEAYMDRVSAYLVV